MGDIRHYLIRHGIKKDEDSLDYNEQDYNDETLEEKVLVEFIDILDCFFKEGMSLIMRSFQRQQKGTSRYNIDKMRTKWQTYIQNNTIHYYLHSFLPDLSEIRNSKIHEVLK